jgi:hypothetical protein
MFYKKKKRKDADILSVSLMPRTVEVISDKRFDTEKEPPLHQMFRMSFTVFVKFME